MKKHVPEQYLCEFIGTFFLVFFGCGSIILFKNNPAAMPVFMIPVIFGLIVCAMIYAVGHISGAHFNPAVTIGFWSIKKFPTYKLAGYIFSQLAGASLAGLFHLLIWGSFDHMFGATILHITVAQALLVEFLATFMLMFVITSVATDSRAQGELAGIAIGIAVALCAFLFGPLTGASMNPARSFGPAMWSSYVEGLWIYFLAPIAGAVCAAIVYNKLRCYKESDQSNDHGCC